MDGLIQDIMFVFEANRPLAYLIFFNLSSIPVIIFVSVRLAFHSMHFDVLKNDVEKAKEDANLSASRAHTAVMTIYKLIGRPRPSSQEPPRAASDAQDAP